MVDPWTELLTPLNGYLVTSSKIISFVSFSLSLSQYPLIASLLSLIFAALVGVAIATAPTVLRGRTVAAFAVFLVPSDPEVFGLPLYSFWWASLLLFLVALWDERSSSERWRLAFLLIGGLSSPVIVMVLPALLVRAHVFRSNAKEQTVALVAIWLAAIQVVLIVQARAGIPPPLLSVATNMVPKLIGTFLVGNWSSDPMTMWAAGLLLLGVAAAWAFFGRAMLSNAILFYLFVGSIALTVARNDPALIHPVIAGPRYFFLPYVCLWWILIQAFYASRMIAARGILVCLGLVAIFNSYPVWSRAQDDLDWVAHTRSCRLFSEYALPVQYDGRRALARQVWLPGKLCSEYLARDLMLSRADLEELPTFPYIVLSDSPAPVTSQARFESGTIDGADFYRSHLDGLRVVGSHQNGDSDTGQLVLRLRRGDHLAYRSGPNSENQRLTVVGAESMFLTQLPTATEWITLDFSNAKLPAEFLLTITDQGAGWGEWFAVGVVN